MPKIVVKVERKAHTRSKTQEERKSHPQPETNPSKSPLKSRNQTPKPTGEKTEVKSTISRIKRGPVKFEDRKFFTVSEDTEILTYLKKNEDTMTSRSIAEQLAKRIKHSVESIRDRIKRFISRLRPADEEYIIQEGKANPEYYVHFGKENDKKKRPVTYISSTLPKLAGSTLQKNEKRALAKQQAKLKKQRLNGGPHDGRSLSPGADGSKDTIQHLSTDELFRLRDERIKAIEDKISQYSTKLRKRSPRKPSADPTEFLSPVIKQKDKFRELYKTKAEREKQNKEDLQSKVDSFLEQLRSNKDEDVEVNAQVLAEIMRNFSTTFGVGTDKIASLISQEDSSINVEDLRKKLVTQGQ